MAITRTNTVAGNNSYKTQLIAATADTSFSFANPFGTVPTDGGDFAGETPKVTLTPLGADGRLADWVLVSKNATTITVAKATTSLSGGAAASVEIWIERPHSLTR